MQNKITSILYNECKINPQDTIVLGFSGGPDSLYMVHILQLVGQPFVAVHVNHKMRPESNDEVQVVKQLALEMEAELICLQADVPAYSDKHSLSLEEAARTLRYTLLFETAEQVGAKSVAVAHTADDQIETILMHLLRGSGLSGLRGMEFRTLPNPWSENIALIRPCLSTWKREIQNFIDERGLKPIIDHSNMDTSFHRNRIRHELLPILEGYNPSIRDVLYRMSQTIADDYSLLQVLTNRAWDSTLLRQGDDYLELKLAAFLQQPIAIQRYLLRKAIAYYLPSLRDVGFDCIERGILFLSGHAPGQTDLIAGLRLIKESEVFWLAPWQADFAGSDLPILREGVQLLLTVPSEHELNEAWLLELKEIKNFDISVIQDEGRLDPFQAWVDARNVDVPLTLRVRKPGDQFKPIGLEGHTVKISDVMINLKIPRRARDTWPLVCSGDEIIWVPGYRVSHEVRVTQDTQAVIHLGLFRRHSP